MTHFSKKPISIAYKGGLIILLTCLLLNVLGRFFSAYAPWQKYMDPRTRILWGGTYDGSKYVMLGDSEFCSYYVDSPEKTIWSRTQCKVNEKVFGGALDGSKPADVLTQGLVISSFWPSNSTVFIDIVPTRFMRSSLPEPDEGNYASAFSRHLLAKRPNDSGFKHLKNMMMYYFGKVSFLFSNETAMKVLVDRPVYYREGVHGNRVWYKENDRFAYDRFRKFESNIQASKRIKPFDWLNEINTEFSKKGIRAVFVLTPLNRDLIASYAKPDSAHALLGYFDHAHNEVIGYMKDNNLKVIDLYNAAGKDDFADMLHTNEKGDEVIADALSAWITENKRSDGIGLKHHLSASSTPAR